MVIHNLGGSGRFQERILRFEAKDPKTRQFHEKMG
jgi:hypothetical protein